MKRLTGISGLIALSALLAQPVLACDYPSSGSVGDNIPHGATASASEMKTAQDNVGSYVKDLEAYIACVDGESSATRNRLLDSRNRAVSEAKDLAEKINREIRKYNRSLQLRQAST